MAETHNADYVHVGWRHIHRGDFRRLDTPHFEAQMRTLPEWEPVFALAATALEWTMTDTPTNLKRCVLPVEPTRRVLQDVTAERLRMVAKWGDQSGLPSFDTYNSYEVPPSAHARRVCDWRSKEGQLAWGDILIEEVADAFDAEDPAALRAELIQVAAVAVAWVEALDRG